MTFAMRVFKCGLTYVGFLYVDLLTWICESMVSNLLLDEIEFTPITM